MNDLLGSIHHFSEKRSEGPLNMTLVTNIVVSTINKFQVGVVDKRVKNRNIERKKANHHAYDQYIIDAYFAKDTLGRQLIYRLDKAWFELLFSQS